MADADVEQEPQEVVEDEEQEREDEMEHEEEAPVEEEDFVLAPGVTSVKLFGKWSFDDIEIRDISLVVRNKNRKRATIELDERTSLFRFTTLSLNPFLLTFTRYDRTTLPARVITRCICHTRPVVIRRSVSARPLVLLWSVWRVA
jgi:hypothetical protein